MSTRNEGQTLSTAFGTIVTVAAPIYGVAVGQQCYEAADLLSIAPAVGDVVLADWLPSSGQWVIVAIVV